MLAASSLAAYCPEAAFMLATQDHASSHCGRSLKDLGNVRDGTMATIRMSRSKKK